MYFAKCSWIIISASAINDHQPNFIKFFGKIFPLLLVSALNYAFESGCLSITQRRGVIKLIPKKDAELYYIKNWRPITLLNTDYKIAAKALANRIKSVLPSIINNDQTGFMKNRFIGENIRLIDCIIQYAAKENISGLLLFIDFEKAFDSLAGLLSIPYASSGLAHRSLIG